MCARGILSLVLLLTPALAAPGQAPSPMAALSQDERALAAYVDAHNDEALALLERVVNINSGTQNFDGVREVGDIFRAELDALGFKTSWVDGAGWQRAGHLVATHAGT